MSMTLPQGSAYVQCLTDGCIVRHWDNGCESVSQMEVLAMFLDHFCNFYDAAWHEQERKAYAFARDWNGIGPRKERARREAHL